MKKLIFTALVAMVAIGGATAQYHIASAPQDEFECDGTSGITCGQQYPNDTILDSEGNPVDESVRLGIYRDI